MRGTTDNRINIRNVQGEATAQILLDLLMILEKRLKKNIKRDKKSKLNKDNGKNRHQDNNQGKNQQEDCEQQGKDEVSLSETILKKLAALTAEVQQIMDSQWQDPRAAAGKLEKSSQAMNRLISVEKRAWLSKETLDAFEAVRTQLLKLTGRVQAAAAERVFRVIQPDHQYRAIVR